MHQDKKSKKLKSYLEVYIKEDGSLIFAPVTNSTSSILDAFSKDPESAKKHKQTYCG